MPRCLNTWTGEFEWHPDPSKVTYAILSHVWRDRKDGGEQSYNDVQRIQAAVKQSREESQSSAPNAEEPSNDSEESSEHREEYYEYFMRPWVYPEWPSKCCEEGTIFARPELSDKIRGFCKVARDAGFRLAWNDACCIDKTSSAELSEAINSMYELYKLSKVCYVYLADVPDDGGRRWRRSKFKASRWHERGWTLQELIAPKNVVFLTNTWKFLGTKTRLASTLETITGVGYNILIGRVGLSSVSVAQRMSWSATRCTTRIEDRAYSLMGIFGVHMSTIYGEGENAFLRLQEEIIRTVPDQSIFAWGPSLRLPSLWEVVLKEPSSVDYGPALLANSPSSFRDCRDVTPTTSADLTLGHASPPPLHCVFTPQGVRMHLLYIPIHHISQALVEHWKLAAYINTMGSEFDTLAFLQCKDADGGRIALPLCRSGDDGGNQGGLFIGTHEGKHPRRFRTVRLTEMAFVDVLTELLENDDLTPGVIELSLLRHYSSTSTLEAGTRSIPHVLDLQGIWPWYLSDGLIGFCIAPDSIQALRTHGFISSPLDIMRSPEKISMRATLRSTPDEGTDCPQPSHIIELSLTLTKLEAQDRRLSGPDTTACIDISSFFETPCVDGQSESHTCVFNSRLPNRPDSKLPHAEFIIYSKLNPENKTSRLMARRLRIALGGSTDRSVEDLNLHLHIGISDEHVYQDVPKPLEGYLTKNLAVRLGWRHETDWHPKHSFNSSSTSGQWVNKDNMKVEAVGFGVPLSTEELSTRWSDAVISEMSNKDPVFALSGPEDLSKRTRFFSSPSRLPPFTRDMESKSAGSQPASAPEIIDLTSPLNVVHPVSADDILPILPSKIDALSSENAILSSQYATLSSQVSYLSSQMVAVLARLDSLALSKAPEASEASISTIAAQPH